jgi:acyl-coenzyme A synthetase/AMP-(fatty) acid ligase
VSGPAVLLNPAGQPAATGEVAELCLGAARTGDLVRRRSDHLLEFVGRSGAGGHSGAPPADLLEAVAALRDLPDVLDAVVTEDVRPDGETTLTAYVANPARAVDLGRLRQHLVTHLPEYLVPQQVVVLERLPLTSGDDYDLAALPRPAEEGAAVAGSAVPVR